MMRKCHLNTCPVGIATQDPELRKKFQGQPDHLINYFLLLAEGLREVMAELGVRRVVDLVGRSDLLELDRDIDHPRLVRISLQKILAPSPANDTARHFSQPQDHELGKSLDKRELWPKLKNAIELGRTMSVNTLIRNTDRTVGTILSGEISRRFGAKGLAAGSIQLNFKGSAGQSFMAFGVKGILARVEGEVNDYCGKGLSGGEIIIVPPSSSSTTETESQTICGNTTLYGATSGSLFVLGSAGERFAVRNSGAIAVVEGAGDHCCEYMTGGQVLVLGPTGRNFGAGMSGGLAFVYDQYGDFSGKVNHEMVGLDSIRTEEDRITLKKLITQHFEATKSIRAKSILDEWDLEISRFVKVAPIAVPTKRPQIDSYVNSYPSQSESYDQTIQDSTLVQEVSWVS